MKTSGILSTVCVSLAFVTSATLTVAQTSEAAKGTQSQTVYILPTGTQMVAEFEHNLNVKKLKPGDRVKAVLTQDLVLGGQVVAPVESKLIGHVVEAVASKTKEEDSRLTIVFDKALLKKHKEIGFNGIIAAMRPPAPRQSMVDRPDQMMPPLMVSGGGQTLPRGSVGRTTGASNSGPNTSTLASLGQIGASPTVQSNPGSNPGATIGGSKPLGTPKGGGAATAGVGVAGVQGIPNVEMLPAGPNGSKPTVIVGKKSNLKLESGTQIILVVAGSPMAENKE